MTESDVAPGRRRLRPVKSAESLASGNNSSRNSAALSHGSESGGNGTPSILCGGPASHGATAGSGTSDHSPNVLSVPTKAGHNRSVSHDSYFEHLAESTSQLLQDEEEGESVKFHLIYSYRQISVIEVLWRNASLHWFH